MLYNVGNISGTYQKCWFLYLQHIPKCIIYDIVFDRREISGENIHILFSFLFISLSGDRRGGMGAFLLMALSLAVQGRICIVYSVYKSLVQGIRVYLLFLFKAGHGFLQDLCHKTYFIWKLAWLKQCCHFVTRIEFSKV